MKKIIRNVLNSFGYRISRNSDLHDNPFAVQKELIKAVEPVIFDIGAHTGEVAWTYRRNFPIATIHSFEPMPESFQALSSRFAKDERVLCHNTAVSDKRGTAILNLNRSSATNSLLPTDDRGKLFWGEGVLETETRSKTSTISIDEFSTEAGISHIDILKLDVQGVEFSVLVGAMNMLKNRRVSLIFTELLLCPTYQGQHKLHEYFSMLDSCGYEILDFYNLVRSNKQLLQMDAILLSADFKQELQNRGVFSAA